ncbi:serine-rich adhesin for platelets-like [Pseudophryne corroboree]|uniref:serine-rich adhesin for platelets-like n=1 Tax=Pseudophryne corroboree TaxID=495146 RepID=UPI003081C1A0
MYRAYQPTLPTANLYLQEKWDRSRYAEHRRKVERAVPAVNCKGFQTPTHLLMNMKKLQMDRDQRAVIERQNHIHSTKLSSIRQSHGRVDNWNYYPQRSLNIGQRHQNLSRITEENGKILERILKRESEYGRWKSEYEKMERIRSNISRYPQDSGPDWEGQQTVTFMDNRGKQVDIYDLVEGSKSDGSQNSRSTLKLESIPQTVEHRTSKEPLYHTEKKRQITPIQAETSTLTLYGSSNYCDSRDGSTNSFHKRGTYQSVEYERAGHKLQTRCKSRGQKCLSNSKYGISNANSGGASLFLEDSDGREDMSQEDSVRQKYQSSNEHDQCTSQSKKISRSGTASYRSTECETVVSDAETKPHMYVGSNQSFDFSSEESDASSCYSLEDSGESPHPSPTHYSRMSKTKAISASPTSQKEPEFAEDSLHRMEISNTFSQYVSRSQNPSPEESKSHCSLLQPTKSNSDHSSRVTNRSTDSLSLVTNSNRVVVSQLTSMTANSSSSSSPTNQQRSADLINQNIPAVTLTRDSRGLSDSSSNVSTKSHFEGKIYKALHCINEALYK